MPGHEAALLDASSPSLPPSTALLSPGGPGQEDTNLLAWGPWSI